MPDCSSNDARPEGEPLAGAVAALRRRDLIVYPTETLYGLGADALDEEALARLIALKGREPGKPISVLVSDLAMLRTLVDEIPPRALRLIERGWPGPLTLVLPAAPTVSLSLTGGSGTIGARISSAAIATELVRRFGRPITSPSANPAGGIPPTVVSQARSYFGDRVAAYVDGGPLPGEPPSTVLAVEGDQLRLIRPGVISLEDLERW